MTPLLRCPRGNNIPNQPHGKVTVRKYAIISDAPSTFIEKNRITFINKSKL